MVTYVRDAHRRNVRLIHHCDVQRIEFAQRGNSLAASGVQAIVRPTTPGSEANSVDPGPLVIKASLVIVSAGAIGTPALLQRSGYPDPHAVGAGLVLHPSLPIAGVFDRDIMNYRGITGASYSDRFYASHGFYYECLFDHPVSAAIALPGIGADHFATMSRYAKLAGFGVMLVDSVDPSNRVDWDASSGAPAIRYRLTPSDKERLRFAARTGVEIMLAAGAKEVILTTEERLGTLANATFTNRQQAGLCDKLEFAPCQTFLSSAHCQGSVKMGEDPKHSVVNSRGETRAARNLIVCDASVFPTSCGVNPMVSVMTLARYQGKRIANELSRYGT
jgi:choline dehydrogenase-like flavoprotein